MLAGRDFTWNDDAQSPKVALVNETFARKMFGKSSAIGNHFLSWNHQLYEIVGVVEDGKYRTLTEDRNGRPCSFLWRSTRTVAPRWWCVRNWPRRRWPRTLDRMLTGIEPSLPFSYPELAGCAELALFPAQAATAALGIMGLLAAMLAVTGIFGMAAYSVSKRMKELGIRIALGAQPAQLMRSALGRPLALLTLRLDGRTGARRACQPTAGADCV